MNRAPAALALLFAACSAQHADRPARSAPSLAETRSWIADRLPTLARSYTEYQPGRNGYSPGFLVDSTMTASLDTACTLRVEADFQSRTVEFGASRSRYVQRIPLRSIDLNSVHVKRHESTPGLYALESYVSVALSVAGGDTLIEKTDSLIKRDAATPAKKPTVERSRTATAYVPAHDDQAAERITKALRRAVELCGGSKEAF